MHNILQLDIQGTPQAWISPQDAALHYATSSVAWFDGEGPIVTLRGGMNASTGRQSVIEIHPIIALRGASKVNLFDVTPTFTKAKLFRLDRFMCAYCGEVLPEGLLQCEHILPESRGGACSWMNLVTACGPCNLDKADRTPDEAGMPLLYAPYRPSRWEDFLLEGRRIRGDVHEWLVARLPTGSRLC